MAEVDPRYVHHGFWTDRSKGTILGQTLTTDTRTSTILIALLAVLTSLGATHLWYILLFIYHQQCAKGTPSDGLTKQRQAIIRTLPEPSALAIESVKIWWAWRQKGKYIFLRCIHLTTLSVLFSLGMLFASVFSAFIVSDTNIRVLVSSPLCGIANASLPNHVERYRAAVAASANSYVRDCYRGWSDTLPHQCRRIFATSIIPFSRADVACPFEPALCENGMGFETDSGLLSMRRYFGLNLSPEDDVQFRRRTTCAVLPAGDHLSISNRSVLGEEVSDEGPGPRFVFPQEEFLLMRYGGYLDSDPEWTNLTFTESLWEANKTTEYYTE